MRVSEDQFAKMFGGELDDKTVAAIAQHDWSYREVGITIEDSIVIDLLERAEKRDFSIAATGIERWQKGWSENLEEHDGRGAVAALDPKYWRPAKYLRLGGRFITPTDPMFEANWYKIFRGWFARRYLSTFDTIWEFGCGSGHNVAWLAQEFPDKIICGADWSPASVEIVRELLQPIYPNVRGFRFDFFRPTEFILRDAAVLTVGALEQTGARWRPFLEFLMRAKPAMCFHIEPIVEWYDPGDMVDYSAIKVHEARGFWKGFVNEVMPVRKHRTGFGSLLLEGYSQFQWDPAAQRDMLGGAP